MKSAPKTLAAVLTSSALLIGLSGCGGSSGGGEPTSSASPVPTSSQAGRPGPPNGLDPALIQQAQECLQAAGIDVPSGLPSGVPSGLPSDLPSGVTPGASPPADFSPPGQGGPGNLFSGPKAQQALKACGITLPPASPAP